MVETPLGCQLKLEPGQDFLTYHLREVFTNSHISTLNLATALSQAEQGRSFKQSGSPLTWEVVLIAALLAPS